MDAIAAHGVVRGGGSIVYTSSLAGAIGEPVRPAYAMAKAGIEALMRHVAAGWGKQRVRANAVAPGLVITPVMATGLPEEARKQALKGTRTCWSDSERSPSLA